MGLTISVADDDPDYMLLEISATSDRYAGTTQVYADPKALTALADRFQGFPFNTSDAREQTFGRRREPKVAGGFCRLSLLCDGLAGRASIEVEIEDDVPRFGVGRAYFGFSIEAGAVDRFVEQLRKMAGTRGGSAELPEAV